RFSRDWSSDVCSSDLRPVPVDIRILATSNRDLAQAVRDGSFREDLLYRLNVVNLKIPPLRDRPADVLALAEHFARKYAESNRMRSEERRVGKGRANAR